jgi:hypothetical protein
VQAVENAVRHGIVVVVAAGNDGGGYASVNSPGNSPSAITVGAADGRTTVSRADDYLPAFSSRGPTWYDGVAKPDVLAPGVNLFSNAAPGSTIVGNPLYPKETVDGIPLVDLSGTSMASAVATGVVALELQVNSHQTSVPLTANAAKAILQYTAIPLAGTDALSQGTGQINAAGAVQLSSSINTTAATGTWWLQTGVSGSSTIGGNSYAWAQNIIWGTSVLTGRFIYYKNTGWDDNIIWGTALAHGNGTLSRVVGSNHIRIGPALLTDNVMFGTDFSVKRFNLVFGTDAGDNIIWGTDTDNIIWGTNLAGFRIIGQRSGDTIRWEETQGTVEQIGLKSTRIRAVTGEEIVISNKNLLDKELHNMARLNRRRIKQPFGLVYKTTPEMCARIPEIVKEVVNGCEKCSFLRCGMTGYGESSLDFSFEFDVKSEVWQKVFAKRHEVLIAIYKRFRDEGIEFASPVQIGFTAAPDGTLIMPYPPEGEEDAEDR